MSLKRVLALLAALCALLFPLSALAAGVSVEADRQNVVAGDTLEVTISVSGEGMAIAEGSFTYDSALLTFVEGSGGATDGLLNLVSAKKDGADSLSARATFTATGEGSVNIDAVISKVVGYDGKEQEGGSATVAVTVAAAAPTPAPVPISYAKEGVLAQNVEGETGELYIWRSLENVTVPSRYSETTITYHDETVAAAKVDDSDAPTLLYLSNDLGDSGAYYIYNEAADKLYRYQTVSSVSKSYIIVEPGNVALPDGFTETTLTIDEKEYRAWRSSDAQGDVYLLYARNPDGEEGYYVYNVADGSLQRYAVMPARPVQPTLAPDPTRAPVLTPAAEEEAPAAEPEAKEGITFTPTQFYIACGGAALLVIIIAALVISHAIEKKRRRERAAKRRAAERKRKQREQHEQRELGQ